MHFIDDRPLQDRDIWGRRMQARRFPIGRLEVADEADNEFGWSAAGNLQCSCSLASDALKTLLPV